MAKRYIIKRIGIKQWVIIDTIKDEYLGGAKGHNIKRFKTKKNAQNYLRAVYKTK